MTQESDIQKEVMYLLSKGKPDVGGSAWLTQNH